MRVNDYFSNPIHRHDLERVIDSWRETPYMHGKAVKGRGVDCSLLIGECFKEIGVIKKIKHDYYPQNWYLFSRVQFLIDSLIDNWTDNFCDGISIKHYEYSKDIELVYGDILVFCLMKNSPVKTHLGFYTGDDTMVHSIQKRNVSSIQLGNYFINKLTDIFRVLGD